MAYNNIYRSLEGEVLRETDKAIQFEICIKPELAYEDRQPTDYRTEWLPKSQLNLIHKNPDSNLCDIIMASEWILGQKNWLKFAGAAGVVPAKKTLEELENNSPPGEAPPNYFSDMDDDIPF